VHGGGRPRHGLRDDPGADKRHSLGALDGQVLHGYGARCACAQVREVPVLVQHRLGASGGGVAHHKHPRPRGQALRHVVVEAHTGQLHGPRWGALDVPPLHVAVSGPRA